MAPIKNMTRENVGRIRSDLDEALTKVAEKYGLTLKIEGGRFDPSGGTFSPKITFVCATADGIPADFAQFAPRYGLEPSDYGKTFTTGGETYALCGIKPRNRKYPIVARCIKGRGKFKFTASVVVDRFSA